MRTAFLPPPPPLLSPSPPLLLLLSHTPPHTPQGRLALHIQLSSELKTATNARALTEVGELEQDLVLGDKSSKDMLAYFAGEERRGGGMCMCV